jgi:EAL domain-containing protein (putative c-di-GMP-specific phosphodiesterase class I)
VDYLKIDGSFIRELSRNVVDQHLVQAIVDVARSLGKQTIAEFVNDDDTVYLLQKYGVDFAQGFHIGRPRPLEEILSASAVAA